MSAPDCTLLVASCDAYSDLWEPYFALISRYWPDCPFPIALITENKRPNLGRVRALHLGQGLDWSSLLLRALDAVSTPYVLLSLEDFFLRRTVDTQRVIALLDALKRENLNMLRLIPRPGPKGRRLKGLYGGIAPHTPYRVSTQAALWRVTVLRQLLLPGESAWQFEVNGSKRSSLYQGFASVWDAAIPYRHHVVERGRWFPWAAFRFRRLQIGVDLKARPVMSAVETSRWVFNKLTAGIVTRIPSSMRAKLKHFAKRIKLLP